MTQLKLLSRTPIIGIRTNVEFLSGLLYVIPIFYNSRIKTSPLTPGTNSHRSSGEKGLSFFIFNSSISKKVEKEYRGWGRKTSCLWKRLNKYSLANGMPSPRRFSMSQLRLSSRPPSIAGKDGLTTWIKAKNVENGHMKKICWSLNMHYQRGKSGQGWWICWGAQGLSIWLRIGITRLSPNGGWEKGSGRKK